MICYCNIKRLYLIYLVKHNNKCELLFILYNEKFFQLKGDKRRNLMKRGYARVSTSGQDLHSQINILKKEKCDVIYAEKFTGTKKNRPEFKRLLQDIEPGETLVVTKLDRFARSTKDALET